MYRSNLVGDRLLRVKGGSTQAIYFLLQANDGSEDLDRGVRGTPVDETRELKPRPTLIPVSGTTITRQAAILRLGDYQLDIAGNQVTELELQDITARIQAGDEVFTIVHWDPKYVDGAVAYFVVFVRGVVAT